MIKDIPPPTLALFSITILGSIYLLMGHNSVGFTALIGAVAGIGGYTLKK